MHNIFAIDYGQSLLRFAVRELCTAELQSRFKLELAKLMEKSKELITLYRKSAQIQLNKAFVRDLLLSGVPAKYLPHYVSVERRTKEITFELLPSLWWVFNDISQNIWEGNRMEIPAKILQNYRLHSVLRRTLILERTKLGN